MEVPRKPRRSAMSSFGSIVCCQNPADHILFNVDAKGLGQVLGDPRTFSCDFPKEYLNLRFRLYCSWTVSLLRR